MNGNRGSGSSRDGRPRGQGLQLASQRWQLFPKYLPVLCRVLYVRWFVVPLAIVDTLHMIHTIIVVALLSLLSGLLYLLLATSSHDLIIMVWTRVYIRFSTHVC
jgi:hypothetical protein